MEVHFEKFRFWLRGRCSPDPLVFGWGGKAPLNGRPQHLIEAAKRGRLDQMLFFSAPLTTRAPSTTVRRPSAGRPTTIRRLNTMLGPGVLPGPGSDQPEIVICSDFSEVGKISPMRSDMFRTAQMRSSAFACVLTHFDVFSGIRQRLDFRDLEFFGGGCF